MGLTVGLASVVISWKITGERWTHTLTPCILSIIALLIGAWLLPEGVEGGLLTLGMGASFITVAFMLTGRWSPDLIVSCTGILLTVPLLNIILLDTSDVAGWDGSRGLNWVASRVSEFAGSTTDLSSVAETAIIAAATLVLAMVSIPIISAAWTTIDDVEVADPGVISKDVKRGVEMDHFQSIMDQLPDWNSPSDMPWVGSSPVSSPTFPGISLETPTDSPPLNTAEVVTPNLVGSKRVRFESKPISVAVAPLSFPPPATRSEGSLLKPIFHSSPHGAVAKPAPELPRVSDAAVLLF
jgi:hypothetical protein